MPKHRGDPEDLALLHRTLADLVRAEMPLDPALRTLAADLGRGPVRNAVEALRGEVADGTPLADAYRAHADVLPPLYGALIEAGVEAGDLAGTLEAVGGHATRSAEIRGKLRDVLWYPALTAGVSLAIGLGLLLFVAPRMAGVFAGDLGYFGPAFSLWPFAVGAGLLLALACGLLLFAWWRPPLDGSGTRTRLALRLPVVGPIRLYAGLADSLGTLALLVERGVSLGRALVLTAEATPDCDLQARVRAAAQAAEGGASLGGAVIESGLLPPSLGWVLQAGERTGDPAGSLADLAAIYRARLDRKVQRALVLVVPVVEGVLGAAVLAFGYGVLEPYFSLVRSIAVVG